MDDARSVRGVVVIVVVLVVVVVYGQGWESAGMSGEDGWR
jgi:hypothetical protein